MSQNADLWRLPVSPATGHATGAAEKVVASSREDSRGAWSPDGRFIAFNSDRGGTMNIWIHDLETKSSRRLTEGAGGDYQPSWSPDGRRLVFFSSR
jgi:TolB protein